MKPGKPYTHLNTMTSLGVPLDVPQPRALNLRSCTHREALVDGDIDVDQAMRNLGFGGRPPLHASERLMYAVFSEALNDLLKKPNSGHPRNVGDARRWFLETDSDYFLSFEAICDHFNLPASKIRAVLLTPKIEERRKGLIAATHRSEALDTRADRMQMGAEHRAREQKRRVKRFHG